MDNNKVIAQQLQDLGWYLTDAGIKKILTVANNERHIKKLTDIALDLDMREIGGGALPTGKRDDKIKGNIVLQVQRVRNIAAPKINETSRVSPRMLLIELTDGQTTINAIEMQNQSLLSLTLPPGRKIFLGGAHLKCVAGHLLLHSVDLRILGGRVESLIEKWELARTISEFTRSGVRIGDNTGPPLWQPFGKKVPNSKLQDAKNFKSLQVSAGTGAKEKKGDNESFNNFRSEAIAEATKQGVKKVFSGGGQQIVDHNIKKIMDKGYSEDDAKRALAHTNNNLERAFSSLKRGTSNATTATTTSTTTNNRYSSRRDRDMNHKDDSGNVELSKPSGNVTLSAFLADKLPANKKVENIEKMKNYVDDNRSSKTSHLLTASSNESKVNQSKSAMQSKFENNMSSSFAAASQRGGNSNSNGYHRTRENSMNKQQGVSRVDQAASSARESDMHSHTRTFHNSSHARGRSGTTNNGSNNNNNHHHHQSNHTHSRRNSRGENSHNHEKRNPFDTGNNPRRDRDRERGRDRHNDVSSPSVQKNSYKSNNNNNNNQDAKTNMESNNHDNNHNHKHHNPFASKRNEPKSRMNNNHYENNVYSKTDKKTGERQQQKQQQPQQQQQQPQQQQSSFGSVQKDGVKTQKPLMLPETKYDASKIIGFQSKETNERAMNLLKTKGGPVKGVAAPQQKPTPSAANMQQEQHLCEAFQAATITPKTPTMATSNSSNRMDCYGMVGNDAWNWQVGDLCLAKYWDDGCYYQAEITAISQKTFVVFFVGYGNHEEVLKTDCLPITDDNNMALNFSQFDEQDNRTAATTASGFEGHQRHRSERQVYVPPPKRSEI